METQRNGSSAADIVANHSPSILTSYNQKGFLRRNSTPLDRNLYLDNHEEDVSIVPELQPPPPIRPLVDSHINRDWIVVYTAAKGKNPNGMASIEGSPARKSRSGSLASSRNSSPTKRPWYPAGRRPSSSGWDGDDRDDSEGPYVVHPTFRRLFDERGRRRDKCEKSRVNRVGVGNADAGSCIFGRGGGGRWHSQQECYLTDGTA